MSEFRQKFDLARKRLRDKLGLPAAIPSEIGSSAGSTEDSGEGSSVLHRVLAFEHQKPAPDAFNPQDSDIIPSPAALSHSLSGRWKQRVGDDGKPFWQRNEREAASSEVTKDSGPKRKQVAQQPISVRLQEGSSAERLRSSDQLLLQLPKVRSLQQAKQQTDVLQLQAYQKNRKLAEAKFLARQAAERLLGVQMQQADQEGSQSEPKDYILGNSALQEHIQALRAAQAHMFELSEQVSIAELATELAEARADFIERNSGGSDAIQLATSRALDSASQTASSAGSSCGSTSGRYEPNSTPGKTRTALNMPSQATRLERLSSSLNYIDLPMTPTTSQVTTPIPNSASTPFFAPATPTVPRPLRQDESSVISSGGAESAGCDSSTGQSRLGVQDILDCELSSGQAQPEAEGLVACDDPTQDEAGSALPPLPDLPGASHQDNTAQRANSSSRYVHIGCALACLCTCVFALWAKDTSTVSFSSRIFPS